MSALVRVLNQRFGDCAFVALMVLFITVVHAAPERPTDSSHQAASPRQLKRACKRGVAESCRELGEVYLRGRGVAQDYAKAADLFERACEAGDARGCHELSVLYHEGLGVAQDHAEAAALHQRACEAGYFELADPAACDPAGDRSQVEECKISLQNLAGTQWVMLEALPENKTRENPMARLRFYQGESGLKVDYSVGSAYGMHTYDCRVGPREITCAEEPKLVDWCLSLEAHKEGSCTAAKLREIGGAGLDDGEIVAAISEAREEFASVLERGEEEPLLVKRYKLVRNNLGNKLQALLDIRVNKRRCQLIITDQYMIIYMGARVVDSNPVGTNPFVQDKENTWLFENCLEGTKFLALDSEEPPTDEDLKTIDPDRRFTNQDTVYYHYVGLKHIEAEEGCTYSADTWAQWRPKEQGVELSTMDCDFSVPIDGDPEKTRRVTKCVNWSASHQWTDTSGLTFVSDYEAMPRAFFGMTRYKTCADGDKQKLDTICSVARIMEL